MIFPVIQGLFYYKERVPGDIGTTKLMKSIFRTSALVIFSLAFLAGYVVAQEEKTISPDQASLHIGKHMTVCGKVVDTQNAKRDPGEPTFLHFGRAYPRQVFSVLIREEHRGKFAFPPEDTYLKQNICVTGRLDNYRGIPQIELRSPLQIALDGTGVPETEIEALFSKISSFFKSLFQ